MKGAFYLLIPQNIVDDAKSAFGQQAIPIIVEDLKIQDCLNSLEPFFIDKYSIIRDLRNAFDHLFLIEKQKLYELLIRLMPARYSLFFNESYFSKN